MAAASVGNHYMFIRGSASRATAFTCVLIVLICSACQAHQLSSTFYDSSCPNALSTIRTSIRKSIAAERRTAASLIRLHFHDCFVRVGGPSWTVKLGRRDSTSASPALANTQLPGIRDTLDTLIRRFKANGLSAGDMVALSGAHTIGQAQCFTFRQRIYNDNNIDAGFASTRRRGCPFVSSDSNLAALDLVTPSSFENNYFKNLVQKKVLLATDQALFNGDSTDSIASEYSKSPSAFSSDFAAGMIRMGDIDPLTGSDGQIRTICGAVNQRF